MRAAHWLTAGLMVALGAVALAPMAEAQPAQPSLPACIAVATESRYVPYGYNHVVLLTNGCSKAATCNVATDVNPKPSSVDVSSGAKVEVLTFSASPAAKFTARVTCKLQ